MRDMNQKKVCTDIAKVTGHTWNGLEVRVNVTIKKRKATIQLDPTAPQMIIHALSAWPHNTTYKNIKHGNLKFEQIARAMRRKYRSTAKDLSVEMTCRDFKSASNAFNGFGGGDLIEVQWRLWMPTK